MSSDGRREVLSHSESEVQRGPWVLVVIDRPAFILTCSDLDLGFVVIVN